MKTVNPEHHGFDRARLDRISGWMDGYVGARKYPGSSVVIARKGDIVYRAETGLRDIERARPFARDTIARLYSMTKPLTSVALMMLVEQGLLQLSAPVSEFIPEFSDMQALVTDATRIDQVEPAARMTLHQLLTHTSGLSYPFNPGILPVAMDAGGMFFEPDQGLLADKIVELATLPLAFQPGTSWEYSVATHVVGRIVEIVSGASLAAFFARAITESLAMVDTAFCVKVSDIDRFAALYTPLEGDSMALNAARRGAETLRLADDPLTSAYQNTTLYSGGGGLVGTIDDYLRFAEMLRRGGALDGVRLLSPSTVSFMMRNHLGGDIASLGPTSFAEQPMSGVGFGLGGSVVLDPGQCSVPSSVGDFSWGGMASTFFWIDPVLELSVVFFTQLSPSRSYPARPQLKALVHGALIE